MAAKNNDTLVVVVDTTVPFKGGSAVIDGAEVSVTRSKTLIPGQVVRAADLADGFVDGLEGEEVLRPASKAEVAVAEEAAAAVAEEPTTEEVASTEEPEVPYVAPVDDGTAGDSGRDLAAEKAAKAAEREAAKAAKEAAKAEDK